MKRILVTMILALSVVFSSVALAKSETQRSSKPQLTFTYESQQYPWTETELSQLQKWVNESYPVIIKWYGYPAESGVVNFKKDPNVIGGLSNPSEITLGVFERATLVHEMVHSFARSYGIYAATYTEGIANAVTIAVMKNFPNDSFGSRNHGGQVDVMFEQVNRESIGTVDGSFGNGFSNRGLRYIQSSWLWSKLILENPNFLVKFNKAYFEKAKADPQFFLNLDGIKAIIKKLAPKVEGQDFDQWYAGQAIFSIDPARGNQLLYSAGDYAAFVFTRNEYGTEIMLSDIAVNWVAYDCHGSSMDGGIVVTDQLGWAKIPTWNLSSTYNGKVKLNLSAIVGGQTLNREIALPSAINGNGVFGVADVCSGDLQLSLPGGKVLSTVIENGLFKFPSAMSAGSYVLKAGEKSITFTKDESNYFIYAP